MKKLTTPLILFLFITAAAQAQNFGYTTQDVGGEFQWYPDGTIVSLQFAFNSKIHNSFIIRAGNNKARLKKTEIHDGEEGSGWGGSLGYRYFFNVVPRRFYIGIRADLWKMNIHFSTPVTESTSKLTVFQPGFEAGYTLLINELFFITPYFLAGTQITLNTQGNKVGYGQGFIPSAGISAGFRF
jgi:hypothetical protein